MTTEQTSRRVAKIAAKWTALKKIKRVLVTVSIPGGFQDWFEMPVKDFKAVMASALTQTQNRSKRIPKKR